METQQPEIWYTEVQQSTSKTVRQTAWVLCIFFGVSLIIQLVRNGWVLTDVAALFLTGFALTAIFALFALTNMTTTFITAGVTVSYFPFYPKKQHYAWDALAEAHVRPFNAMQEYLGWGVRFGPSGMAYSVLGNTNGLQLVLKNGNAVLISTAQPQMIEQLLDQLHRPKP